MAKKFSTLREKMSPKARARARARADAMIAEMALPELRRAFEVSQEDLAKLLKVTQANVSKIESRSDLHLSTLVAYIEALGGEVEILAHFPKKAGAAGQEVVRLKPLVEKETA
jgi:transcriptional regulator with XRE-family HTH domain